MLLKLLETDRQETNFRISFELLGGSLLLDGLEVDLEVLSEVLEFFVEVKNSHYSLDLLFLLLTYSYFERFLFEEWVEGLILMELGERRNPFFF